MKNLTSVTTALFDFDGVLGNSSAFVNGSFEHVFKTFNVQGDPRKLLPRGATIREIYGAVAREEDLPKFIEAHIGFQTQNLHLVTRSEGAAEVLEHLHKLDLNIGMISNRANIRVLMDHCELSHPDYYVVGAADVLKGKPDPEGILKAMNHFGSKPEETVMVGDMRVDILAGKAAKVMTVAVNTSDCTQELVDSEPDFFIERISDLLPLFPHN